MKATRIIFCVPRRTSSPLRRLLTAPRHRSLRRTVAGFSLVEVATAIAVIAFAFVGLLGLVPKSLSDFRSAMDYTIGAQISQRVITDLEQTDFDLLLKAGGATGATSGGFFNLPVRFFDEQGREVNTTDPKAANAAIYQVLVRGSLPGPRDIRTANNGFTSLPADSGKTRFEPRDSIYATVQVAFKPGVTALTPGSDFLWAKGVAPLSTYRTVITRNGYNPAKKP